MSVLTLSKYTTPILDLSRPGRVLLSRARNSTRLMKPPDGHDIIGTARLAASHSFCRNFTTYDF